MMMPVRPPRIVPPRIATGLRFTSVKEHFDTGFASMEKYLATTVVRPKLARMPPPIVLARPPSVPPPAPLPPPAEDVEIELSDDDIEEVYAGPNDVGHADGGFDVSFEEEPSEDFAATRALELPPPPPPRDPSSARYVVMRGSRPGEITLRALDPGEPPPFGAPIAKLDPRCPLDSRHIGDLLYRNAS